MLADKYAAQFDAYKGTAWYTLALRWAGCDIGCGSIILGNPSQEMPLLHCGRDIVVEQGGGFSTHYIDKGRFHFKTVR